MRLSTSLGQLYLIGLVVRWGNNIATRSLGELGRPGSLKIHSVYLPGQTDELYNYAQPPTFIRS